MNMKTKVWPNGIPSVGQKAQRTRLVTNHDIKLFTEISGDRNPLHYDEELAKSTRFGGIVIQGGITSAILNAVVAEDLPGPGTVFLQVTGDSKHLSARAIPLPAKWRSPRYARTNRSQI